MRTWIKTLAQLWATKSKKENFAVLSEILSSPDNREFFLGVQKTSFPTAERIIEDLNAKIRYSQSSDYAVFAKEAWWMTVKTMDNLLKEDISDAELHFHRGVLAGTIELLKVSYKARSLKEIEAQNGMAQRQEEN